jgi:hypothetical protein
METTKNKYFCVNGKFVEKYGLIKGIILSRIEFWVDYNKEKKQNFYDNYHWSGYLSAKNISEQVCIPIKTIEKNLSQLLRSGVLIKGNYNKKGYDKTNWYRINPTLPERITYPPTEGNLPSKRGYGDTPVEGMHILPEGVPIPVNPINLSINKNINQTISTENIIGPGPMEYIEDIIENIEDDLTDPDNVYNFLKSIGKDKIIPSYQFCSLVGVYTNDYLKLTSTEERKNFIIEKILQQEQLNKTKVEQRENTSTGPSIKSRLQPEESLTQFNF